MVEGQQAGGVIGGRDILVPVNAQELLSTHLPEPAWVVPDLIPTGLTVLAGKPKVGKSYLVLGLCADMTSGGQVLKWSKAEPQEVLYISLEDSQRLVQRRLRHLLQGSPPPGNLNFVFQWPRLDQGGLDALDTFLKRNPSVRFIVFDTFVRIRGRKRLGPGLYEHDHFEMMKLKAIADEHRVGVMVVHHMRKANSADQFDLVSGSTGLTAAADTVALLLRERSQADASLYISGREIKDRDLALKFQKETGRWQILGQADEIRLSQERREVLEFLRQAGGPVKLGDMAASLGKKRPVLIKLLGALIDQGLVWKPAFGVYQVKGESGKRSESCLKAMWH